MELDFQYLPGQTPLDEDEKEGLLIRSISTRGELDEFEQQNIEEAVIWTLKKKFSTEEILSEAFICQLHTIMYREVWRWAGDFRQSNKNIGVDKYQIGIALRQLTDDAKYWVEHATYENDELVIRFKHQLVNIHCFPNGNGRHSRLIADVLASHGFNNPVFSWGGNNLVQQGDTRQRYLEAIWAADAGNVQPLIDFARS
ncbi:MAG TPA: mobile mystery protein B, partial [Flavitalea sp.]|nr:mobile mystery protein B [Flavitalea sp.]